MAEDAVQETLTLVYRQLRRYQPGTSLRAFLAAIAVRQAQGLLRADRRRRRRELNALPPRAQAGPDDVLAGRHLALRIQVALAELPQKRREAALLRLDAGLDDADIAEALGSTTGSVRVLVHQALQHLKAVLGEDGLAAGRAAATQTNTRGRAELPGGGHHA